MNETKLEVEEAKQEAEETRLKIEEEIMAREKADIGDVVQRIRESGPLKLQSNFARNGSRMMRINNLTILIRYDRISFSNLYIS